MDLIDLSVCSIAVEG